MWNVAAGALRTNEWRQVVTDAPLIYSVPVVQCSCLRPSGIFTSLLARRTKPVSEEPFLYKVHVIGMQERNVNHVYFTIGAERIRYKFIGLICQWTLIPRPNIAASAALTRHSTLPILTTLDSYSIASRTLDRDVLLVVWRKAALYNSHPGDWF